MDVVTLKKAVKDAGKYTDQEVSALEALFADSRIVEMGENANGRYVRWENGLQICTHKTAWNSTMLNTDFDTQTIGGITFYRADVTWQFPSTFDNVSALFFTTRLVSSSGTPSEMTVISPSTSLYPDYHIWSVLGNRGNATIRGASFFAIGFWKEVV